MHYHYATGIPGYGPDGADGYPTCDSLIALAEGLRDELRELSDMLYQDAQSLAEDGDFEGAWLTIKRIEAFDSLRGNLDPARATAPLYAGNPQAFDAAIERIIDDNFTLEVTTGLSLYAWPCDESDADCEHANGDGQ